MTNPPRPSAQFDDHPNVVAGRAALPRPLEDFAAYEFATQCPTPACRFRCFPVAPIAEARPGVTVAGALAELRCRDCGEPPEIVLLTKDSLSGSAEGLALRIEADPWKPLR
ncbi:hypothetical protein [Falsiroseomonas sp. E2-1-a20]|uniref:hypothetical protein n=1 Tax=Falsiroseomonas sp. E2-1-a20 TaxID=3239300 RepID=UPI003F3E6D81